MMFAAAALAVCTGTAYGQVLDVAPVGDAVMPDGRRVYAMPQTTVVVDITVARESVVTGPYARFAQKYFGVIAPLADKAGPHITYIFEFLLLVGAMAIATRNWFAALMLYGLYTMFNAMAFSWIMQRRD